MTMPELLLRAAVRALKDDDTDDARMLIAASKEVEQAQGVLFSRPVPTHESSEVLQ